MGANRLRSVFTSASDMLKWAPLRKSFENGLGMKLATAPMPCATFFTMKRRNMKRSAIVSASV